MLRGMRRSIAGMSSPVTSTVTASTMSASAASTESADAGMVFFVPLSVPRSLLPLLLSRMKLRRSCIVDPDQSATRTTCRMSAVPFVRSNMAATHTRGPRRWYVKLFSDREVREGLPKPGRQRCLVRVRRHELRKPLPVSGEPVRDSCRRIALSDGVHGLPSNVTCCVTYLRRAYAR